MGQPKKSCETCKYESLSPNAAPCRLCCDYEDWEPKDQPPEGEMEPLEDRCITCAHVLVRGDEEPCASCISVYLSNWEPKDQPPEAEMGQPKRRCGTCKYGDVLIGVEPCASCMPVWLSNWEPEDQPREIEMGQPENRCETCKHVALPGFASPCVECSVIEGGSRSYWELKEAPTLTPPPDNLVAALITDECEQIAELLRGKNAAYGNSVFDPMRVFSESGWEEAIDVRIDDKLSRIARGSAAGEDAELDLIGYLILKRVGRRFMQQESDE